MKWVVNSVLWGALCSSISYATDVSGNVSGRWTLAGSPYIATTNITVPVGQNLLIDAGVVVQMSPATSFFVNGAIQTVGSSVAPVIITSLSEGTTSAAPGQWQTLALNNSTAATVLAHTIVRYGHQVTLTHASPVLNSLTVSQMSDSALASDLISSPTGSGLVASNSPLNCVAVQGGVLTSSTIWSNLGLPYCIVSAIVIQSEGRLQLNPGVIVKSILAGGIITVAGGALDSEGTTADPVIFTSIRDDSVGGDTNNDQSLTSPTIQDWGGLAFSNNILASSLKHTIVRFCSSAFNCFEIVQSTVSLDGVEVSSHTYRAVHLTGGVVSLTNSILTSGEEGIALEGGGVLTVNNSVIQKMAGPGIRTLQGGGFVRVSGSTLTGNGGAAFQFDPSNTLFDLPSNTLSHNSVNGIYLNGASVVDARELPNFGTPYVINEALTIKAGGRLRLDPGVVVKSFLTGAVINVTGGTLDSHGTPAQPVIFTSIRDDSVGGHTNGDGETALPSLQDWGGLFFSDNSLPSHLENTIVRFCSNATNCFEISKSTVSFDTVQISSHSYGALHLLSGAVVSMMNSLMSGGNEGIVLGGGPAQLAVHSSVFLGQANASIVNKPDNPLIVDATDNYWGASSGPTNGANPDGAGGTIIGNVKFVPFRTSPSSVGQGSADVLPPRTTLGVGAPNTGQNPIVVSTHTALTLTAADDLAVVGDGQGVGVAQSQYQVDAGTFSIFSAPFVLTQPGAHRVSYFSSDLAGHVEASTATLVLVDTSAPTTTLTLTGPAYVDTSSRTFISSGTLVGFDARDSTAAIALTQYRVDPDTSTLFRTQPIPFTLAEGAHTVEFQSQNKVEILEPMQASRLFVDGTAPASRLTLSGSLGSLADGAVLISPQSTFGLSAADSGSVISGLKGIHVALDSAAYSVYTSTFQIAAQGRHLLRWYAEDNVGNAEVVQSTTVVISTGNAPTTALAYSAAPYSDAAGHIYLSSSTGVAFKVNDHGNGTAFTHFWVDSSTAAPFQVFVSSFTLDGGVHQLAFQSQDLLGNLEAVTSATVSVDTTPPHSDFAVTGPSVASSGTGFYISSFTQLSFSAIDVGAPASGVQRVSWSLDSSALSAYTAPLAVTAEGAHRLRWLAQDNVGNSEAVQSTGVVVDATPPNVQIVFSPDAVTDSAGHVQIDSVSVVAFQIQDALSGFATALYRIDGAANGSFAAYRSPFTLALGTHTLEVIATDRIGNTRQVAPFVVQVGTVPPAQGGSLGPTGGSLPDGTPVIASPVPLPVPFPGDPAANLLPSVQSVAFSPAPPVGRGLLSVTIRFSKAMDNTVLPLVQLAPSGQTALPLNLTRYVGDTWEGTTQITSDMNSGAAVISVSGARDGAGAAAPRAVTPLAIAIPTVAPPVSLTVLAKDAQVLLSWPAIPGATYNVYRATFSLAGHPGRPPIVTGAEETTVSDFPSADVPSYFYAVSAVASDGTEGPVTSSPALLMPLPPAILAPKDNANVDVSSIIVEGIAQPGTVIDLSIATSSAVLTTVSVSSMSTWSGRLALGYGPFRVSARTRSLATGQVSPSSATVSLTAIDFPVAPVLSAIPGDTTVSLSWSANPQPGVTGFNLYRDGAALPLNAAPLPITQSSYQDLALTNGRRYSYAVTSFRSVGVESLPSNVVGAVPVAGPGWGRTP